ncbi:MAG: hypothetical protein CMI54_04620 [Parcubacteria group bacterium]|nr:hypothetical protein [Parcubacteria group bacterium]|tara:strand:+ start:13505 stop:15547 length:2043 start_codon:yes stop_codon:yes gene_type:complete
MLELDELKSLHDKAYNHGQVTREQASDDLIFYWVTQWDDTLLNSSTLQYRGEFNMLRKAGRQVMADLRANPIQVNFDPQDPEREDGADFLDGKYRADDRKNSSIEAYDYANQDSVVCGFGAWELYTDYERKKDGSQHQVIKRRFIPEACNTSFCDPNAKRIDKSDAMYWSVLTAYSEDGYKELVTELTGEEDPQVDPSFKNPEQSYVFPWFSEDKKVYVTSFYHKELVKDRLLTLTDLFGSTLTIREKDLGDRMDELLDQAYSITDEKDIERWQVTKYIASGEHILSAEPIAGEYIPVVPVYGERSFVEGEEYFSGITRLAKDPQRLRNFQMSYLADIVSRSPRPKPIYTQEQIAGVEWMYQEQGPDNNVPYLLQHRKTEGGEDLPLGPVGMSPEQTVPQALMVSMELTSNAVEDVANPGIPQNIADPDLSGKAVVALQNQINKQSYIYQHNMKFAKRYDGMVYASMASVIYDAPRQTQIELPNGQRQMVSVMDSVMDKDGSIKVINDITNAEFEVFADIGPSYDTQKQETQEMLMTQLQSTPPNDPMFKIIQLKLFQLTDGVQFDDIRDYARKQLIVMGVQEPENEEDEALVAQSQQSQGPDPMVIAAMAEMKKAEADQMDAQTKMAGAQTDQFNAETKRMDTMIKAQEAGAKITNLNADTRKKATESAMSLRKAIYGN